MVLAGMPDLASYGNDLEIPGVVRPVALDSAAEM